MSAPEQLENYGFYYEFFFNSFCRLMLRGGFLETMSARNLSIEQKCVHFLRKIRTPAHANKCPISNQNPKPLAPPLLASGDSGSTSCLIGSLVT